MGTRLFTFFVCAVILVGLIWVISHSDSMDRLSKDLREVTIGIQNISQQIETQQQQLELRIQGNHLTESLTAKTAERNRLTEEVLALEAEAPKLAQEQVQAILKVRESTVGMTLPQVPLTNRPTLESATIQKITNDAVTIAHSLGVVAVRAEELPPDLQERLRLGQAPDAPRTPSGTVAGGKPSKSDAPFEEQMQQHQRRVTERRLTVQQMGRSLERLRVELQQAEMDARTASSATQKYITRNRRDQLKAQLSGFQRSYDNAFAELQRLEATPPSPPATATSR